MTLIPTQVAFRGLPHSDDLESDIRERVARLEQFYSGIVRCRVAIELPHRHRQDGRHVHVRMELTVPGAPPIVASHEPSLHARLKDFEEDEHHQETEIESVHRYAAVAIREAFDAARRRLEGAAREPRGAVKTHEVPAHGAVVELETADGDGFIQAGENRTYGHPRECAGRRIRRAHDRHARGICRGAGRERAAGEHRAHPRQASLRRAKRATAVVTAGAARVATAPAPPPRRSHPVPQVPRAPRRSVENIDIARIFEEIADLLEIQGENQFRVRAYRTAARTIETLGVPAASVAAEGRLDELPGIGSDLAGKVRTILQTGTLPLLQELTTKTPEGLVQMLRIPGLGPKRAKQIYDTLGIATLEALETAANTGKLRELPGIKSTIEHKILQGLADLRGHSGRWRLADADAYVHPLIEHLKASPAVAQLEVAGSYRRRKDTVGDIDILVASSRPAAVVKRFISYPRVKQVQAEGPTRSAVVLDCGLQVDLRVIAAVSFGSALHYFTGSKPHNIALRALGRKRSLKINEYGVFRGTRRIGGRTEVHVFDAVGLPWIPPELREARGEIEAARSGHLPKLVELSDIRGDLQVHTTATDGVNDLGEMVEAARQRGYEYIAITDHTKAVRVAGGLTRGAFHRQFQAIERIQKKCSDITILKGAEVDILDDGALDLDDATLAELDVVIVAVHSKFNLSRAAMTKRIIRAVKHPHVQILAHPTGRLIGRREPYQLEFDDILEAAADHGVALEINAQPERLDLDDVQARAAQEAGVALVISTDAHRIEELNCMRYGVDQARRAWCEARHILNTRPLAELRKALRR